MEEKKIERELMSQEEFEKYISDNSGLKTFIAVDRFKSIGRAIRRGLVAKNGMIYPKRPFNNRANTCSRIGKHSRVMNQIKKEIYGELRKHK